MTIERENALHYGWHIVWTGTFCIFACLGLGRFALGMILPAMGQSLHLSYSQMGLIGTMNFAGYLVAVLFCGSLVDRLGYRRLIVIGLAAIGLTMILIGRSTSLAMILVCYTITGMGSGAANVPMMGLISQWFAKSHRGKATGFVVIGSGFAILLSGRLVPFLNNLGGAEGWRLSWQVLGVIILLVAGLCLIMLRNSPQEKKLRPLGETPNEAAVELAGTEPRISLRDIAHLGGLYFLFGYTYVIYATFIVTSLIQEHGFSEAQAGSFWSLVGGLSLLSGPIFGSLSDRIGRKYTLAIIFAIQTAAYLLVSRPLSAPFLYLSIGCFGVVAWSIPSIMAALAGDYGGPRKAARIFGLITFIFALGQIAGPAIAGLLAEKSLSFGSSFLMAACFTATGVMLALSLRAPAK
ncbi:MAG: YbfB/YjiJ family MFS transporter [Desulfurivibrio sp.]|nr:YbfB/YjiJ family MFS transporter [Desulfurivibrio sp.]